MTARRIPLKTNPFPFVAFTPVNQRIAPTRTTTKAEIFPMKIRTSQISMKYPAIKLTKSVKGLRSECDHIGFTQQFSMQCEFKDLKEQLQILQGCEVCQGHNPFLMPYNN